MRKVLIGVILLLLVVVPFAAVADDPEELCVGVTVRVYGKSVTAVPEQCVPCTWRWCETVFDRCPRLACGASSTDMVTKQAASTPSHR